MSNDNLATWVDRGWEALTLARFLVSELAFDTSCPTRAVTLGQRLTELATGFDLCNQPPAVRLVSGLAEAFTEFGRSNSAPPESVLDVIEGAIQEFGDMLVELDATGQAASSKPSRATVRLEAEAARQRSLRQEEGSPTTSLRIDHSHPTTKFPATITTMHDALQSGERIFLASESLWKRLQSDNSSPYMTSVSRIHHLAETLRGQLSQIVEQTHAELKTDPSASVVFRSAKERPFAERKATDATVLSAPIQWEADQPALDEALESCDLLDAPIEVEADITELFPLTLDRFPSASSAAQSSVRPTRNDHIAPAIPFLERQPQVVVVDESPFFRMLLRSAIEAAGHQSRVLDRIEIDDALLNQTSDRSFTTTEFTAEDIVVWSGANSSEQTARLVDWAQARDSNSTPTLIRLLDGPHAAEPSSPAFHRTLLRNQIPELLSAIDDKLGPNSRQTHAEINSAR